MRDRTTTIFNSFLLFLICATMLVSAALRLDVGWVTYLTLFTSALLAISVIFTGPKFRWGYVILMSVVMLFHYFLTPDRITTTILFWVTIFLFEAVDKGCYSYKIILYPLLMAFLFGFVFTIPDFLTSIAHTSRSNLYQGFFQNANSFAAFCLMTLMCVILFMRRSKIRLAIIILLILNIYSSGSRNAMLFLLISLGFYYFHKTRYAKFAYILYVLLLLLSTFYLLFLEMTYVIDFTVMGKAADSAGRSAQIAYIIGSFPIKLFGCGKDVIDAAINSVENFSIHNFYINSLYSLGVIPLLGYFYYIYYLWKNLPNIMAKAFLLAFNIYFFFEPGTCYYLLFLNVMPIIIILLTKQQPNYNTSRQI